MAIENGEWIINGVEWDDPNRIKSPWELIDYVNQVGFLPLFENEIKGFSAEERTSPKYWWSGDAEHDPWEWREIIARSGQVAYGKFFHNKAGFISKEWLPYFANYRRDGYDFDARYEDGLASRRSKKIMDLFEDYEELFSFEMKKKAGFGKDGEKNFSGVVSELQMQTYLVMSDFRSRKNKAGEQYGWPVAVYSTPEQLWGRDLVASAYREDPKESWERIVLRVKELYPLVTDRQIMKVCK